MVLRNFSPPSVIMCHHSIGVVTNVGRSVLCCVSSAMLMAPMRNNSLGSFDMAKTKKKIPGNKKERFLGILLDAIGDIRQVPAKILVVTMTISCVYVHTHGGVVQYSGEPIEPLTAFFVCSCSNS
jgi:hypothetical protein